MSSRYTDIRGGNGFLVTLLSTFTNLLLLVPTYTLERSCRHVYLAMELSLSLDRFGAFNCNGRHEWQMETKNKIWSATERAKPQFL